MDKRILRADLLLFLASAIWGFTFVAQRVGMDFVGPFIYNSLRFGIGALVLLPVLIARGYYKNNKSKQVVENRSDLIKGGLLIGLILFSAAGFQQVGLLYTTAGKAGFITGLYVVFVPLLGLFWRQKVDFGTWVGGALALVGLYFLSGTGKFIILKGDALIFICAILWGGHVLAVGYFSKRVDPFQLAFFQFTVCAILSLILSLIFETTTMENLKGAMIPILYAGIMSAGIAFTIQVVAQRDSPSAHAAIIMSLEAVFAVIGGWLFLQEFLSTEGFIGCALMLTGMILSQIGVHSDFDGK